MPMPLSRLSSTLGRWLGPTLLQFGATLHRAVTLVVCMASLAAYAAPCQDAPVLQTVLPGLSVAHGHWPAMRGHSTAPHATTVVLWSGLQATVLDPGPTHRWGQALRKQLHCQHRLRVVQVINSHAHAEHVLANSAMAAPVTATATTRSAMRQRCPDCLAALRRELGNAALQGSRITLPQQTLHEGQTLRAGGRDWQVLDMQGAHTESDLVLWSQAERIVLAGPLLDSRQLVLAQGSVRGWLQALARIEALQPQWLLGQHLVAGPEQVSTALAAQRASLCALVRSSWQGLEQGWSEAEALQALAQTSTDPVTQRQHRFNWMRTWREMEGLWIAHQPMPSVCSPDQR